MISCQDNQPVMVTIQCLTYNQEQYIRNCLDGFVIQRTNFRFEVIVHDDASTDGTANIIREYEIKYPEIIKPILEKENQYSKHDGSLRRIMDEHTNGKYVAICEGDDYWTDPLKLQKQYDLMESHPNFSLCFHANNVLYPSGQIKVHRPNLIKVSYNIEDAILGGGGFMATNSIFYKWEYIKSEGRPDFWKHCPIGDLPQMLYYSTKGQLGYIDEIMSVYRCQAVGSWSLWQNSFKKRNIHYKAIVRMFDEFDEYTGYKYHSTIKKKKNINRRNHIKSSIIRIVNFFLRLIGVKR